MRLRNILSAMLLATCASALPALGCYGTEAGYVAYDEPPVAREEVVVSRPGFFFVHGHWDRDGSRWRWRDGYYERERPGYVYSEGRWERYGDHYRWHRGEWRARAGIVVR